MLERVAIRAAPQLAILCLVFAAGEVHAQIVDTFTRFCIETDGRPEAVAHVAELMGWQPAPDNMVADVRFEGWTAVGFQNSGSQPDEFVVASVSDQASNQGGAVVHAAFCSAMATQIDSDVEARLTQLVPARGVSPEGRPTWIYSRLGSEIHGERDAFGSKNALNAIARQRPVFGVTLRRESRGGGSLIAMGMIPADPPTEPADPPTESEAAIQP